MLHHFREIWLVDFEFWRSRRASSHTRSAWWLANIEVARPSGFGTMN